MRYWLIALISLALMAVGGCGSEDEDPTGAGVLTQQEDRSPAQAPPSILNAALTTMRQLGLGAARELGDVGEDELRPADAGAERLIERGRLDEDRFCTAERIVVEAEASDGARSRFAAGWRASAPAELDDLGPEIYEALSTRCSEG